MADNSKNIPAQSPEDYVTIQLFKDGERYRDDVTVSVNGETVKIQRGIPVRVKRKFAEVLEASMAQDNRTAMMQERLSSEFEAAAKRYNV